MALYQIAVGGGVINTSTGEHIPNNPGLRKWDDYVAWEALPGNTADVIPDPDLDAYKAQAIAGVNTTAERKLVALMPDNKAQIGVLVLRFDEAIRCDAALIGVQTADNFPLLGAEVGINGATVADVADNVNVERLALATSIALIESVRRPAVDDILDEDTDSIAAVDAIVAALSWP